MREYKVVFFLNYAQKTEYVMARDSSHARSIIENKYGHKGNLNIASAQC
jgi:hypothetical protein